MSVCVHTQMLLARSKYTDINADSSAGNAGMAFGAKDDPGATRLAVARTGVTRAVVAAGAAREASIALVTPVVPASLRVGSFEDRGSGREATRRATVGGSGLSPGAGTNLKRRHAKRRSTRRRTRRSRRKTRRRTERSGAPRIAALLRDRAATSLRAAWRRVPDLPDSATFSSIR